MPINYTIDLPRRLVISKVVAPLTGPEVISFCEGLANASRFEATFNQLHEIEPLGLANMHHTDLNSLRTSDPFDPKSRRAVVVHSNVDYGVARMYEELQGGELRVFRSTADARRFLGLAA